jgi:hypothetical protein
MLYRKKKDTPLFLRMLDAREVSNAALFAAIRAQPLGIPRKQDRELLANAKAARRELHRRGIF